MVLFDLDQTLVDTDLTRSFKDADTLREGIKRMAHIGAYDGISDLLSDLKARSIPVGIVSNSSKPWIDVFVKYYGWDVDVCIGRGNADKDKPHPEPIHSALELCKKSGAECIFVGDKVKDIQAAKAAGLCAFGAALGIASHDQLKSAGAGKIFESVGDLHSHLSNLFGSDR